MDEFVPHRDVSKYIIVMKSSRAYIISTIYNGEFVPLKINSKVIIVL